MRNITIIGASAGVGLATVNKSLAAGHRVTILSRTIENLPQHQNLIPLQGSAKNIVDVSKAIADADAIIVTLGTGTKIDFNTIFKGTTLYTDAADILVIALKELNRPIPLIVVTGFGAGNSKAFLPIILKIFLRLLLRKVYNNKTRMEEIIISGYSEWTIVRPGVLTDKPATGNYRVYTHLNKSIKIADIPRADVADFLNRQAEIQTEKGNYVTLMGS